MTEINKGTLRAQDEWARMFKGRDTPEIAQIILSDISGWSTNLNQDRKTLEAALDAIIHAARFPLAWAVLRFYGQDEWDAETKREWQRITGHDQATTRALCDLARHTLGEPH